MADALLTATRLAKSYGEGRQRHTVLDNASLTLNAGDFAVLLGPSGSGKSTLLHIIGLLDNADSGSVVFNGKDILSFKDDEKARVRKTEMGFVFQFDSLLPEFTLLENVDMPARIAAKPDKAAALELITRFGLRELAVKMPAELSGGERQRGAVARALRNKPRLILADEPTGNLDLPNARKVYEDFKSLSLSGIAVLMATHNPQAVEYANRVFNLSKGVIEETAAAFPA